MDEPININVDLHKTDRHYIAISKTRLWAHILSSMNWLLSKPISGRTTVQNGLGLIIINNLAIVVEGFITDILLEHLAKDDLSEPEQITKMYKKGGGWNQKKKLYNEVFQKQIESYGYYESIKYLFFLRNNISHGKTHSEIAKTEISTQARSVTESVDENYQKVREYLIKQGMTTEAINFSNVSFLWKLNIALFFFSETKNFLSEVIKINESTKLMGIENELKSSYYVEPKN